MTLKSMIANRQQRQSNRQRPLHKSKLSEAERSHVDKCSLKTCELCKVLRLRNRWAAQLPLLSPDLKVNVSDLSPGKSALATGSWFHVRCNSSGEYFGCGCIPCNVTGQTGGLATFERATTSSLQICNLLSHQQSKAHVDAVKEYLGVDVGPRGLTVAGSPPVASFKQVWDNACAGIAPKKGSRGIGKALKIRRLEACLVAGIKILDRRFVSSPGAVLGLTRDERRQRLLLQFRGCNDDLQVRNGILGQAKHFGTGSSNIVAATKKVFEQFCTPMCKAPMRAKDFIITKNNDIKQ